MAAPLTSSLRGPWLSSTSPSGPDAVSSAIDDAEGEDSGAGYGRNYVAASMPALPQEAPIIVVVDGWRWSSAQPTTGAERGSMSNSATSEAQGALPAYGRAAASGSLLADELTTHLVHAEESHGTRASTSLVVNPLATTSTSLSDAARRAADELDDRLTDPWMAGEGDDQRGDGESDGMIDLDSMGTLRRGRRLAAGSATQAQGVNPRLARLTDLALLRDAPSLMRELAQIARDALFAADDSPEAGPPEHADDRMLDLLAADVGTLGKTAAASMPGAAPLAASQPLSLEAGVALYQAFDLALAEEAASGGGAQASNSAGAAQATAATEEPHSAE
jgi:hypothetical protein